MLIATDRILLPSHPDFVAGWVEIDGEAIISAGPGWPLRRPDEVLNLALTPGYVDVHCHGGGGAAFATDDPSDVDTAIAAHRAAGTTSVASLITASIQDLHSQVALLAGRVRDDDLAGIHLEGPMAGA